MADNINGIEKYLGDSQLWDMPKKKLKFIINDGAVGFSKLDERLQQIIYAILKATGNEDLIGDLDLFRVIDAFDSFSRTDALSANKGRELYELIQALQDRLDNLTAKIILTPNVNNPNPVPYTGDTLTYQYTTEGTPGDIYWFVVDEEGNVVSNNQSIMSIGHQSTTSENGKPSGIITIYLRESDEVEPRNYKLVVRGISNNEETCRAESLIKQSEYPKQFVRYEVIIKSLTYSYVFFTGGTASPTLTGRVRKIYDKGPSEEVSLTDAVISDKHFVLKNAVDRASMPSTQSGDIVVGQAPEGSLQNYQVGLVDLQFKVMGNDTIYRIDDVPVNQIYGEIYARDAMYKETFTYPNLPNTGTIQSIPTIVFKQKVYFQSGSYKGDTIITINKATLFSDYHPIFTIGSGASIGESNGVVTRTNGNSDTDDKTYNVTMKFYENGVQRTFTSTVTQPGTGVANYTVTFNYPQIGYDGGSSTPTITVKKNGSTITNYNLNITGVTITSVKEGSTNVSTTGFSGNKDTKGITAPANTGNAKTIYATITGTIDGVIFTSTPTVTQNTIRNYIWCGYSGATPTSFEDCGNGTRYTASNGLQVTVNTRDNYQGVLCHWIMIPDGSSFQLSEALDAAGTNIKKYGAEILANANNAIKDGKGRAFYMWHLTNSGRYMERATKFIITKK